MYRLDEQSKDFALQREAYERELTHLRQLVRERDELVHVVSNEKQYAALLFPSNSSSLDLNVVLQTILYSNWDIY